MFKKSFQLTAIGILCSAAVIAQNKTTMKTINNNAPVKCSKSIVINAPADKVWNILSSIDAWSNWQSDIPTARLNGELKTQTTFDWKTGGAKIHSTLHTVEPAKKFGWTGKTFGMYAIHNWTLIEHNGTTQVLVEESMEGFFASLLKTSFNKNLARGMQHWLELLKAESEK